jgi:hypothetical protein
MKILSTFLYILTILIFINGCGKKTEDNSAKPDSTARAKSDTVSLNKTLQQPALKGFYDTSVSFSDYIEQHPNLKKQVEFEDIIAMLAVDKSSQTGNQNVMQAWEVLADRNTSPVNWLTSGGGQTRVGEIILKFDGKPVETLDTYLIPAIWKLTLSGSKAGVDKASLDCDVLTDKLGHLDIPALCKKNNTQCTLIKSTGDPSTGAKHYQVDVPGKESLWLVYDWSCGSGGCSADFTLFYNKNSYDQESKKTP